MRLVLIASTLLLAGAAPQEQPAGAPSSAPTARPTNVVLIMADDLGYECIAANGGTSYSTPRLDRMAAEGIRFTDCHSTPLCTPSRVQIMTGQYSFRNYERFGYLNPKERTFGNVFQDAGFATCIVGKWQLTYGDVDERRPATFGFDTWCLWNAGQAKKWRYQDPLLNVDGDIKRFHGEYGPDVCLDHGLRFIEEHADDPFFVYFPMILPHAPFVRTPDTAHLGEGGSRQENFSAMVTYMDKLVGRLLDRLVELDIDENTLVLFVGDNGVNRTLKSDWNGSSVAGGKSFTTHAGTHVPMIAWWPGTAEPAVLDDLVDLTDFLPTIADVSGIEIGDGTPCDGRSFAPRLRGEAGDPRDWIFCHYDPRWDVPGRPGRYAYDGRHKLYDDGRLYDVRADRVEEAPLGADDDSTAPARAALQAVLDSMPAWTPPEKAVRPGR